MRGMDEFCVAIDGGEPAAGGGGGLVGVTAARIPPPGASWAPFGNGAARKMVWHCRRGGGACSGLRVTISFRSVSRQPGCSGIAFHISVSSRIRSSSRRSLRAGGHTIG